MSRLRTHLAATGIAVAVLMAGAALAQDAPAPDDAAAAEGVAAPPAEQGEKVTRLMGSARLGRRLWVTGASVVVRPESASGPLYLTTTDEHGAFRFEDVPEGSYRIEFRRHGLQPIVKEDVELKFPFRAVVEVLMEPVDETSPPATAPAPSGAPPPSEDDAGLVGRVTSSDGKPQQEVRVRMVRPDGSADPREALTREDGAFRIDGIPAGEWRLEVLGAGFLPIRASANLTGEVRLSSVLVRQPADYLPAPLDLMPVEQPLPPPAPLEPEGAATADAD